MVHKNGNEDNFTGVVEVKPRVDQNVSDVSESKSSIS